MSSNFQNLKLNNIFCNTINRKKLQIIPYLCDDMSVKNNDKTYTKCNHKDCHKDHQRFGYLQLFYLKNPFLYVTTPPMKCLFGIQKNTGNQFSMSLQFTNLKEDNEMIQFFEFIQEIEFMIMEYLKLDQKDSNRFVSQIKYDKQNKYDPNLNVKLPFSYNKFETDIYSDNSSINNIFQIQNFTPMQCDIYLDKIWKMNDHFYAKWKCKIINLL